MWIEFEGPCNREDCEINYVNFRTKDGHILSVDREQTEWIVENGRYDMLWKNCYLLRVDGQNVPGRPLDQNDREILRTSTFDSFEYDDEADPGYQADVYQFYLEPVNS